MELKYNVYILVYTLLYRYVASFSNLARSKLAFQSSTHGNATASNAIDGNRGQNYYTHTCAHTATQLQTTNAWWTLDLRQRFNIYNIVIYHRTDAKVKLTDFFVYITDNFHDNTPNRGYECYHHTGPDNPNSIQDIKCNYPGRYVVIYKRSSTMGVYIHLCEVEVYGCNNGLYGTNCNQRCSPHCLSRCDIGDVTCSCKPGYIAGTCTQNCTHGYYGDNCSQSCSIHCLNNCNNVNGHCTCSPGFTGHRCTNNCPRGSYGERCNQQCSRYCSNDCNHINGHCMCSDGYIGDTCSQKCPAGHYGDNCGLQCSDFCSDTCNNVNGHCTCKLGYMGARCIHNCTRGYYGDCRQKCSSHCQSGTCNNENGHCTCQHGYIGDTCTERCTRGSYGENCRFQCSAFCSNTCNNVDGTCTCKPGYIGAKCTDNCKAGKYGHYCGYTCSDNCLGICDFRNGSCTCKPGYRGDTCGSACKSGYYGDNCIHQCSSFCYWNRCDNVNGHCSYSRCKAGYSGDKCTNSCGAGWYGENCKYRCSIHCLDTCDFRHGNCKCKPGFREDRCTHICHTGLFGENCSQRCSSVCSDPCNNVNGHCTCKPGYTGDRCTDSCNSGWYGQNCSQPCSQYCENTCRNKDGYCTCKIGYQGWTCEQSCQTGFYGKGCTHRCSEHCANGCNNINGTCLCKTGFTGNSCTEECPHPTFGISCNDTCHCLNRTSCDNVDGICSARSCDRGWNGSSCNQRCPSGTFGYDCTEVCDGCVDETCDREEGLCTAGCKAGLIGSKCDVVEPQRFDAIMVGGGIGAALVLLILAVGIIFCRKRKRQNGKNNAQTTESAPVQADNVKVNENASLGNDNAMFVIKDDGTEDNDNVYANTEISDKKSNFSIPVKDLAAVIERKNKKNDFENEFKSLGNVARYLQTEGTKPENKIKNRYLTTFPYDHSRVVLEDTDGTDYINANYIKSYSNNRAYIATQGPKLNTLNDFWQMVWQEDVGKIVMVTQLKEGDKKKCYQYWPNTTEEPLELDTFTLNMRTEREHTVYIYRSICVTNKKTRKEKTVLQFHFTQWPDHGVPDKTSLVKLHRKVKSAPTSLNGPLLVHCSAGLGRTGTYIALDALFEDGQRTGAVDVKQYTEMMRKDRMNMIQNFNQYKIVHEALLEEFTIEDTSIPENTFLDVLEVKKANKGKEMRKEFQSLKALKPVYDKDMFTSGKRPENASKNAVASILPHDDYRPFLLSFGSSRNDYINAVILPGYTHRHKYIVTQYPLQDTVGDFWSLIYDLDCSTVVLLEQPIKGVQFIPLEEEKGESFDNFIVTKKQTSSTDKVLVSLQHKRNGATRNISMFVNDHWPLGKIIPTSEKQMADFVGNVSKESMDRPLVIVCRDGSLRSGVFAALSLVLEQIKLDSEVDICQAVRSIQVRRPEFMSSLEQYEFCYRCIGEYLSNDTLYANM